MKMMVMQISCSPFSADSIQCNSQATDVSVQDAAQLSQQLILARQLGNRLDASLVKDLALYHTSLEAEVGLGILSIVVEDLGGRYGIGIADSHGGGTLEVLVESLVTSLLGSQTQHSVLGYEVINASFTQLLTQLGIVLYGNTLIVNNDAGNGRCPA